MAEKRHVERLTYSIEEAAEASGLSASRLYKSSSRGEFNDFALKIGNRVLLPIDGFHDWLKKHKRGNGK